MPATRNNGISLGRMTHWRCL